MARKQKQYRVSERMERQVDWLARRLGYTNASGRPLHSPVIRLALGNLFVQFATLKLVETVPGAWALVDDLGDAVATCTRAVVDRLPAELRQQLQSGMPYYEAIGALGRVASMLEESLANQLG